jgi:hypothetical protein
MRNRESGDTISFGPHADGFAAGDPFILHCSCSIRVFYIQREPQCLRGRCRNDRPELSFSLIGFGIERLISRPRFRRPLPCTFL